MTWRFLIDPRSLFMVAFKTILKIPLKTKDVPTEDEAVDPAAAVATASSPFS